MDTGSLITQIEKLTQRANISGIHFHTVSSLNLLTQNHELKLFASHHKQIVESVYGHQGHGILANQTPMEIAQEMQSMRLLTWITYGSDTPIATSSFQLTENKLYWDVVRCAKNPQFKDFPGSLTILISLKELLEHQDLIESTIGLSGEIRTGHTVKKGKFTIPGGPQMLLTAMNHLEMTPFGFEPLIATAWNVIGRIPLTEFFQISHRFWNPQALRWWKEPFYIDHQNPLLMSLIHGVYLSNTGNYPYITETSNGNQSYDQTRTVIKTYGNQFAEVYLEGDIDLPILQGIHSHLFKKGKVRFIRFILENKPQNVALQKTLAAFGAIPTVIKPPIVTTIFKDRVPVHLPAEIWFGFLMPGTAGTLIPFGLSKLHDEPDNMVLKQFAVNVHAQFSPKTELSLSLGY